MAEPKIPVDPRAAQLFKILKPFKYAGFEKTTLALRGGVKLLTRKVINNFINDNKVYEDDKITLTAKSKATVEALESQFAELQDQYPEFIESTNKLPDIAEYTEYSSKLGSNKHQKVKNVADVLAQMKSLNRDDYEQLVKLVASKNKQDEDKAKKLIGKWKTILGVNEVLRDKYVAQLLKKYHDRLSSTLVTKK